MLANCDVIVILPIYGQFGAIRKPDSGRLVYKTYISIKNNFLSYKNWKQNWNISNTALILLLWVKVPFLPKTLIFRKKIADISKIKRALALTVIDFETAYVCVLTHQISSF